jgi:hypothetical protein
MTFPPKRKKNFPGSYTRIDVFDEDSLGMNSMIGDRSDDQHVSGSMSFSAQDSKQPRSAKDIVFVPPQSVAEARRRIADLTYDIAHIDQQFAARKIRGVVDPNWAHRASRARMVKDLERERLRIWIEETRGEESWDLLKAIVETVKPDYDPDEWKEVMADAYKRLRQG